MSDIKKISDEELEQSAGGMIFNAYGYEGNPSLPWEVLHNENCSVLASFSTKGEAEKWVTDRYGSYSYNTLEVDRATVERLRANPNTF